MSKLFLFIFAILATTTYTLASNQDFFDDTIECYGCKLLIREVEKYIDNNTTITQVENYIKSLCTYTNSFQSMCEQEVTVVIRSIVTYLENEYSSTQICQLLGYCPKIQETIECLSCKILVQQVEDYLLSNSSITALEEYVYSLCNYTKSLASLCHMEAKLLIESIVEYLKNEFTPNEVCQEFGICPVSKYSKLTPCNVCQLFYSIINESNLDNSLNMTEKECAAMASLFFNRNISELEVISC